MKVSICLTDAQCNCFYTMVVVDQPKGISIHGRVLTMEGSHEFILKEGMPFFARMMASLGEDYKPEEILFVEGQFVDYVVGGLTYNVPVYQTLDGFCESVSSPGYKLMYLIGLLKDNRLDDYSNSAVTVWFKEWFERIHAGELKFLGNEGKQVDELFMELNRVVDDYKYKVAFWKRYSREHGHG